MPLKSKKPLAKLQALSRLLGWRNQLRLCQHRIEKDAPPDIRGKLITWYEAGRATGRGNDCFLQINESPQGQTIFYHAAVYAIRYRICTGWHEFQLFKKDDEFKREVARLKECLAWEWFATLDKRRAFRKKHPQCVGFSWRKIGQAAGV